MTEIVKLRQAIRDLHGLESEHVRSEPVHETFQGETVWDGVVEVFHVFGHKSATEAYAWNHETADGGRHRVAPRWSRGGKSACRCTSRHVPPMRR